jgi:hypothetical protein
MIMNFTTEQLTAAKTAQSPEELKTLAAENGITLTDEEAKCQFAALHAEGALADEELDSISGGGCSYHNAQGHLKMIAGYARTKVCNDYVYEGDSWLSSGSCEACIHYVDGYCTKTSRPNFRDC